MIVKRLFNVELRKSCSHPADERKCWSRLPQLVLTIWSTM